MIQLLPRLRAKVRALAMGSVSLFATVASVVLVTAVASTAGPVWRATLVDPAVALRAE